MASITFIAHNKSQPSTRITAIKIDHWQPLDQHLQPTTLVEFPNLVAAADESPTSTLVPSLFANFGAIFWGFGRILRDMGDAVFEFPENADGDGQLTN
uniref:Uncharacterized protein n=1 Tax=Cannabis sativa TaxID=3483 RepID=A0A803P7G6_CANSA